MKRKCMILALCLILAACSSQPGSNSSAGETTVSGGAAGEAAESAGETETSKNVDPSQIPSASADIFAMDTYMTVTCYGERAEEAVAAAQAEIERLDDLLSIGKADSEISRINRDGSGVMSEDTNTMVTEALRLYDTTGGAFDITVYPLMDLWGFTTGNFAVPDAQELSALLAQCGSDKLTVNGDTIMLAEGQGIDLGGIAKGYTSGHLMEIFEEYDLVSAVVSLGGNVQCYRTKTDGSLWRCGIQDPQDPENGSAYLGVVSVADQAVITSGAYERYFVDEATGTTYHHILDPKTGYPAESGLLSVTVVSADGMLADGLSTSCYVMGLEQSAEYWRNYGADFDLILMDENGEVYVTEPLSGQFTSDYKVHVISQEGIS